MSSNIFVEHWLYVLLGSVMTFLVCAIAYHTIMFRRSERAYQHVESLTKRLGYTPDTEGMDEYIVKVDYIGRITYKVRAVSDTKAKQLAVDKVVSVFYDRIRNEYSYSYDDNFLDIDSVHAEKIVRVQGGIYIEQDKKV